MFFRLFLLFSFVPLIELYLLIRIGNVIGAVNTIVLVFVTGIVGAYLARREGIRTFQRIQVLMGQGEMPGEALLHALLILMAGLVLITPGILTDVLGLLLLIPVTRQRILVWLRGVLERKVASGQITTIYRQGGN